MKTGDIIRTTSLTIHSMDGYYRENWKCKKGFRYVLALIAVEEIKAPVSAEEELKKMGWKRTKK